MSDLFKHSDCEPKTYTDHERDAVLGAFTAFAQNKKLEGWINLFEQEKEPIIPFNYSVGYWMPWNLVRKR
jgi:hypothetical protein